MVSMFVMLNPIAGQASVDEIRQAIDRSFTNSRHSIEIYETSGEENVAQLTRDACQRGVQLVVAAGGDGTVAAVVNGHIHNRIPLGIIPAGTGNGLARALGIPLDLEEPVSLLAGSHSLMDIDAMRVGDQYFTLNVSVGFSARAMRRTEPKKKRRLNIGLFSSTWSSRIRSVSSRSDRNLYKPMENSSGKLRWRYKSYRRRYRL